ncbi:YXWGXW repeat-containing protein [bacterium]|nr:YXWGXW repeat-containing protein [bacterium]
MRVREAPPVARVEVRAACPGPAHEYHWIEGHWQWDGHRWVWYGGHWHRIPPAKHAYVSGVWRVHGDGGYIWVAGHWD